MNLFLTVHTFVHINPSRLTRDYAPKDLLDGATGGCPLLHGHRDVAVSRRLAVRHGAVGAESALAQAGTDVAVQSVRAVR